MWIIDKILGLFGARESFEEAVYKMPPEEFQAMVDKVKDAAANVDHDDEPVEKLYVEYDGLPLPAQGVLKEMGYRVGKSGLSLPERREILRRTFQVQLVAPLTAPSDYIAEWGERCSYGRFIKMDNVLGGLAANAERKTKVDMSEAIHNWKQDQAWLRQNYQEWMDHTH
jgi:hypothetical protein